MAPSDNVTELDPEIAAISAVVNALRGLPKDGQQRVIRYVANKLNLAGPFSEPTVLTPDATAASMLSGMPPISSTANEGISPVAARWLQRSGLNKHELESIYSIGLEQIDLITTTLPGKGKRQRMRNVVLLLGIASYLSTGAARVSDEDLRQTCQHYDAYDPTNFASYLKGFAAEVAGNKDSGYTLTSRGLIAATTLIKSMIKTETKV